MGSCLSPFFIHKICKMQIFSYYIFYFLTKNLIFVYAITQ